MGASGMSLVLIGPEVVNHAWRRRRIGLLCSGCAGTIGSLPCHVLLRSGTERCHLLRAGGGAGGSETLAEARHVAEVVVAEDMGRPVAGDLHGVGLLHAAGSEVGRGGVPRVMEHEAAGLAPRREPRLLARARPGFFEVADACVRLRWLLPRRAARAVEEVGAVHGRLRHLALDDGEPLA